MKRNSLLNSWYSCFQKMSWTSKTTYTRWAWNPSSSVHSSFYWNFLLHGDFLSVAIFFFFGNVAIIFVPLEKCGSSLCADWERRHCGWFQWQLFRGFKWKSPPLTPVEIESQRVDPCMAVGGGIISVFQHIRPFLGLCRNQSETEQSHTCWK